MGNIWLVNLISSFEDFSQSENHWTFSAFHLQNSIWDTCHLLVECHEIIYNFKPDLVRAKWSQNKF